jgi:hypothetical protein
LRRHHEHVARSSPRLSARLIAAAARADDGKRPIAETYREVASVAERLGLSRPSYESIRLVVHSLRARKRDPSLGEVLLEIDLGRRDPRQIVNAVSGTARPLPK